MSNDFDRQRKHVRFKAKQNEYAEIDQVNTDETRFKTTQIGLIFEEAHGGCGLVVIGHDQFIEGDRCLLKVGELSPIAAEVRWRKPLEQDVLLVGFKYLN